MLFPLAVVAWGTATACYIAAKLAGFGEAAHAALLIMMLACGVQVGSLIADRRDGKGGGR